MQGEDFTVSRERGRNTAQLALATDKIWTDRVTMHMLSVKANGPKTRRAGLAALTAEEVRLRVYVPDHPASPGESWRP